jgi:hypothetical protein
MRKLDRILGDVRTRSRRVYEGIRDLEGIRFRLRPDAEGDPGAIVLYALTHRRSATIS